MTQMTSLMTSTVVGTGARRGVVSAAMQVVAAFALGAAVIYGVGFSHNVEAHNVTHDSRHAQAFPCH